MKVSDAYPSKYLKASDLNDTAMKVVIEHIEMEDLGDDTKPVMYFRGLPDHLRKKGLVTNKTNANNIKFAFGDEMDEWIGKEIELFPTLVDFQGRSTEAIRVRMPRKKPAMKQTPNEDRRDNGGDDEVPF